MMQPSADLFRTRILNLSPSEMKRDLDQVTVELALVDDDADLNRHRVALEIRGRLWARPAPESLYIRTELDLESGSCTLERL